MGQFLNCVYGSSRIVLLTIQELSKAQCNDTDITYTDYNNTYPFRRCFGIYGRMARMRIGSKYLSIENCNLKLNFEKKEV